MSNPIKPTLKTEIIPITVITIMALSSIYFYSVFPEVVATHWNMAGEVNGWSSRTTGAFAIPSMAIAIYLLMQFLPALDPKKDRYAQFSSIYHIFKNAIILFMALLYFSISANALGHNVNIGLIVPMAVGVLFIILGNYLGKIKSNWFFGIRTPWTLSSEEIWNKTQRFSGKIFIISGLCFMVMPFLPIAWQPALFIIIITIIIASSFSYSYISYRHLKK